MISGITSKFSQFSQIGISDEEANFGLEEDDIKRTSTSTPLLLHDYSMQEITKLMTDWGIFKALTTHGFDHPHVRLDTSDTFVHRVSVTDDKLAKLADGHNYLIDLFLRRRDTLIDQCKCFRAAPEDCQKFLRDAFGERHLKLTVTEWLRMQNPLVDFAPERPQLPGQTHPGLQMSTLIMRLVSFLCSLTLFSSFWRSQFLYFRLFFNPYPALSHVQFPCGTDGRNVQEEAERRTRQLSRAFL